MKQTWTNAVCWWGYAGTDAVATTSDPSLANAPMATHWPKTVRTAETSTSAQK